ncbi:MAG: hypothetical protein ACE5QF_02745 [Thermoplasmata archaeon]
MHRDRVLDLANVIFWVVLIVALAVSLHLGLGSTYVWYTEKTSFHMYLSMTLLAVLILEGSVVLMRVRARAVAMAGGDVAPENPSVRGEFLPLIAMASLFLACSAFAFCALESVLLPNYRINTVFILFTGSLSKIVIGLFALVAFRVGLRRPH